MLKNLFHNHSTTPKSMQTIEALWRLEKIILDTLDFNEVTQKIVDSLLTELEYMKLGYEIIVLALVDKKANTLKRVSISQTPAAKKALELSPIPFPKIDIPLSAKENLCIKAFETQQKQSTQFWPDILMPAFKEEQATEIQKLLGIKTSMVYPVIARNESLGILIFSMAKTEEEMSYSEKDLLGGFTDVVGLAVQNAALYTSRQETLEQLKQTALELKQKNKNLEVLRKMDSIITTTLDLKEMCQKIVDTISWELGYDGALISLVDENRKCLVPTTVSQTPNIKKALALLPKAMSEFITPMENKNSMAMQALNYKSKVTTTSLAEAFDSIVPKLISDAMQEVIGLKGIIIYPLMSKDRPLGVLCLGLHVKPHDLTPADHNLLDAFMEEVGIALENASLYEEVKRANDALKVSNQKLIDLDKMKDEFVSVASHELRTPMTAINGYVWMVLQGRGGDLTEKQKNYLNRVAQSTQRLINLVNDMLSVSRIEGGRIKIEPKDFDLAAVVKDIFEELKFKAEEKHIVLIQDSPERQMVFADPDKTHEVLVNLIGNSLKFTDGGTITVHIKELDTMVAVAVEDTGKGISQDDMPKLFQKFGRLDNQYATVAETTGTGLGLYICKKYIDLMGGEITAKSEVGKGSTFTFTLPKSG